MKNFLIKKIKPLYNYEIYLRNLEAKSSPQIKIQLRQIYAQYCDLVKQKRPIPLKDTGFRVFSQYEEDGMLLYIFACLGMNYKTFIDIGSSDGLGSNCANLALNFGWHGLFIDADKTRIANGKKYYQNHPDTNLYPPVFINSMVKKSNINQIIKKSGYKGKIDLLSIDIDGNDYWIWDSLTCVDPQAVMIETNISLGLKNLVFPYDEDYSYPGVHPSYHGASVTAMQKLAHKKGYCLVGANNYGFNTIYVKKNAISKNLPEVKASSILKHPRCAQRAKVYQEIKNYKFLSP